ncbi:hypothetical protein ACFLUU_10190 [Chloroflexota bacterium]
MEELEKLVSVVGNVLDLLLGKDLPNLRIEIIEKYAHLYRA